MSLIKSSIFHLKRNIYKKQVLKFEICNYVMKSRDVFRFICIDIIKEEMN